MERCVAEVGDHVLAYSYNKKRNRLTGPYRMTVEEVVDSCWVKARYDHEYPRIDIRKRKRLPRGISGVWNNGSGLSFWMWERDDGAARRFVEETLANVVRKTIDLLEQQKWQNYVSHNMDIVDPGRG